MSAWTARSAWLWTEASAPASPAELASFAVANGTRDVWVSVPWGGPTRRTAALVHALTAVGARVACLGGDPVWAMDAASAASWTRRALASGLFSGVHLDIEPWVLPSWPADAPLLLDGLTRAVRAVAGAAGPLPVDVDLPGWLARTDPDRFRRVVDAAAGVVVMAYRDRAAAILADGEAAVAVVRGSGRRFRIGVDAVPSLEPRTTFFDDGRDALARHTSAVAAELAPIEEFAGIAVHDLAAWRALAP